jgi:probable rRNA maturation factor
MSCQVVVINKQKEVLFSLDASCIQNVVQTVLSCENQVADFLSVEFVSDAKTQRLHKRFFGNASSTDCMSFPIDVSDQQFPRLLGDIFICPKTALKQASDNREVFFDELTLYLVHGVLHLLGYDDVIPQDRKKMRQREGFVMKRLRKHGQILSGKIKL